MKKVNLLGYRYDKYSQTGNDGIIEYILNIIGVKKGLFVEFGAWDGVKGSNCRKLFKEGWGGIFIEPDSERYKDLKNNYRDFENIICINRVVGFEKNYLFDDIVGQYVKDGSIDFCSIDIDGLDLEVFETFNSFMPTVICIEGGQMLHPYHDRVRRSISKKNIQQSLKVMSDSFEEKGYKLLCSYQDSFFIKEEYYKCFEVETNLMKLYFDGLRSLHKRMPWIYKMNKKAGLKNPIIDGILKDSGYFFSYKYADRKKWAADKTEKVRHLIEKYEKKNLKNQVH